MFAFRYRLGTKIIGILVLYFVVALVAIGMTLQLSTDFEGGAAAINEAGAQRMRTYRLALLAAQVPGDAEPRQAVAADFEAERQRFDEVLAELERGDPVRPLYLPREPAVSAALAELRQAWIERVRPRLSAVWQSADVDVKRALLGAQWHEIEAFVDQIDALVARVERSNARNTTLLRSFQLGLLLMALVGTAILILWFHAVVLRPIGGLREGIRRMAAGDFAVRVPVEQHDELGELGDGFNRMADELSSMYGTLAERVGEKTRSLAEHNRDLTLLYEITAFLNEPAPLETLCQGFLERVISTTGADGGVVRLIDAQRNAVHLLVHAGVSETFAAAEAELCLGECVCGTVACDGVPKRVDLDAADAGVMRFDCRGEGFRQAAVFTIRHQKQLVGVFSLYSRWPRHYDEREVRLLETLGQHLGLAVENQRLVSREKDMAVSEERNVLAQELHDSIAQSLAFLNLQAQMVEGALRRGDVDDASGALAPMREGIQESYDHVRELLAQFRTRMRQADLDVALRTSLQRFEGQTGIATTFEHDGTPVNLPPESELQVLHIVQEALSNARKHACAQQVVVRVSGRDGACRISIADDGIGFDPLAASLADGHMGLQIMRERAHRIGGRLCVRSRPDGVAGTEVGLELNPSPNPAATDAAREVTP